MIPSSHDTCVPPADWMSALDDARPLHTLTLPGSHDTCAYTVDDLLVRTQEQVLAVHQKIRNNACDRAAVIKHRTGQRSHQAHRSAAINEPKAVLRQNAADLPRRERKCGYGT